MLVVGDLQRWLGEGRKMPVLPGLRFAGLSELTPALIEEIKPEIVISALMCPAFDALDVAAKLAETGYTGRYRALSETLPNPQVIRAEVRSVAPDLDFDLFQIAPPTESTNQ
ncbi:MAG: hypothetical protein JKX69_05585 [Rhodobacteraceae bacterium]|nr:hypothetical protein [Paracoccaceae bacterium]